MFLSVIKQQQRSLGALRQFATINLQTIRREDVIGARDTTWIGDFVKTLAQQGDQTGSHSEALNEYFRKNFRKMTAPQAKVVISSIAEASKGPIECLDEKFWVWETLEEAVRGEVEQMSEQEVDATVAAFYLNFKGSHELRDRLEMRILRFNWSDELKSDKK